MVKVDEQQHSQLASLIHTANNAGDEPAVVLIANLLTAGEPVSTFLEEGTPTP